MTLFVKKNWLGIFWSLFALLVSLTPGRDMPQVNILNFDKLVHFVFYGLFYVAVRWGLQRNYDFSFSKIQRISIVYTSIFGLLMECCQGFFIVDRRFDLLDGVANILGVIFVALLFQTTLLKHLFTK